MERRENEIEEMRQRSGSGKANTRIVDRESDYQRQHMKRMLSPEVSSFLWLLSFIYK